MIVSAIAQAELERRIGSEGLAFECGPFVVRVHSQISAIPEGLQLLYADYPLTTADEFADVELRLMPRKPFGGFGGAQVIFDFSGERPFAPMPVAHAWPCFEWALNWVIASNANNYLILHAAVVERNGRALILPGRPGSGKSTLCAALSGRDWRLLSDELTLLDLELGTIVPLTRPISLKNQSIQIIREYVGDAVLSRTVHYTTKGSVAHLRPQRDHVRRIRETATPGWVVFPKYVPGASTKFSRRSRADTVLELGDHSFNYHIQGEDGFEGLVNLVEASECHDLIYGNLDDAIATLDQMGGATRW